MTEETGKSTKYPVGSSARQDANQHGDTDASKDYAYPSYSKPEWQDERKQNQATRTAANRRNRKNLSRYLVFMGLEKGTYVPFFLGVLALFPLCIKQKISYNLRVEVVPVDTGLFRVPAFQNISREGDVRLNRC